MTRRKTALAWDSTWLTIVSTRCCSRYGLVASRYMFSLPSMRLTSVSTTVGISEDKSKQLITASPGLAWVRVNTSPTIPFVCHAITCWRDIWTGDGQTVGRKDGTKWRNCECAPLLEDSIVDLHMSQTVEHVFSALLRKMTHWDTSTEIEPAPKAAWDGI